jgi:hypothetical protein
MFKKLIDHIMTNKKEKFSLGLGVPDLPNEVYKGKQPFTSNDFKKIVNEHFLPKIYEKGFKGKDFLFYRENEIYTEIVFFWTYKTGGAIQVDLCVKFNNIIYPDNGAPIKSHQLRPENCELVKRLSPSNQEKWFWIFQDDINDNIKIVDDIWRLFSEIGVDYFKQFENHQLYLQQLNDKNFLDFSDFRIAKFFGRFERGIIFFLFDYWRQQGDKNKALMFAKVGLERVEESAYQKAFNDYITQTEMTEQ